MCIKGKISEGINNNARQDNIHLTLVFIGETQRLDVVVQVIETTKSEPFDLELTNFGCFRKKDGNICWVGIKPNNSLASLQGNLLDMLCQKDFEFERLEFNPHITLARRVLFTEQFDLEAFAKRIPLTAVHVRRISLMKSENIGGKLTYTEIYSKNL